MPAELDPLEPEDRHRLNAAEGWLGLGDFTSARDELARISRPVRSRVEVLLVHGRILMAQQDWARLIQTAGRMVRMFPEVHEGWVTRSYALHETQQTVAALDALLPAARRFPESWVIPYNLACYCAQTGRLAEATQWLETAIVRGDGREIRRQALADADLQPLWQELRRQLPATPSPPPSTSA